MKKSHFAAVLIALFITPIGIALFKPSAISTVTAPLIASSLSADAEAQSESVLQAANRAYYAGEYRRSLSLYEQLARKGNAEAAERAGFMLLQADGHYGQQVRRDVRRAMALIVQAAQSGRSGAGFLLNMLDTVE